MITADQLTPVGKFNKTHGIKGEISATFDLDLEPSSLRCLFVEMDGIPVPFFITSSRPKTAETWLLTLEGIESGEEARQMVNKTFFALTSELPEPEPLDPDADGFYASDLIGWEMVDSVAGPLGTIRDVNDSTDNVLFVVERPDGSDLLVPVADEFIDEVDTDTRRLLTTVPQAILELNA